MPKFFVRIFEAIEPFNQSATIQREAVHHHLEKWSTSERREGGGPTSYAFMWCLANSTDSRSYQENDASSFQRKGNLRDTEHENTSLTQASTPNLYLVRALAVSNIKSILTNWVRVVHPSFQPTGIGSNWWWLLSDPKRKDVSLIWETLAFIQHEMWLGTLEVTSEWPQTITQHFLNANVWGYWLAHKHLCKYFV